MQKGFGFLGGVDGEEIACNAGDVGWIPELGRSLGEGHENHSSILAHEIPWKEPGGLKHMGVQKSWTQLSD